MKCCCCANARMVLVPLMVSRKLLYIGERLTESILFSWRELATYTLCPERKEKQQNQVNALTSNGTNKVWCLKVPVDEEPLLQKHCCGSMFPKCFPICTQTKNLLRNHFCFSAVSRENHYASSSKTSLRPSPLKESSLTFPVSRKRHKSADMPLWCPACRWHRRLLTTHT